LGAGIQATISDLTSHYFGGYFHVRIRISADIPVSADSFPDSSLYQDAVKRLGSFVNFNRILEKMAVPDGEIDAILQHLLSTFDTNMLPYLMRADFAASYVQSEYRKAIKSNSAPRRLYS
jgi:hypothetical protein